MSRAHAHPTERALAAWVRLTRQDPLSWDAAWHRSVFVGALSLTPGTAYYGYRHQQVVFVIRYTPEGRHRQRKPGQRVGWIIEDCWALPHWVRAVTRYEREGSGNR